VQSVDVDPLTGLAYVTRAWFDRSFLSVLEAGERYVARLEGVRGPVRVDPAALAALTRYPWKGNVRELENTIERLLILRETDTIRIEDLPDKIRRPTEPADADGFSFTFPPGGVSLAEAERLLILEALERSGWNQTRAAQLLRVPRHILLYRMDKFGIPKRGRRADP